MKFCEFLDLSKQRYMLMFFIVLVGGCGRFSTDKGVADCNYEAVKQSQSESKQNEYVYACMKAKGYEMSSTEGCSLSLAQFPYCWEKTRRILYP